MIKTNRGVYPTRNGQLTAVGIEISGIQLTEGADLKPYQKTT